MGGRVPSRPPEEFIKELMQLITLSFELVDCPGDIVTGRPDPTLGIGVGPAEGLG
jgi:hypothetical protein